LSEAPSSFLTPETTEVLYGLDNIQRRVIQAYSWIKDEPDGCVESTEVAMNVRIDAIREFFVQLKKKGVKLRAVIEVTESNIDDVKKLMEIFEVRHLAGLKSNFGIVDRKSCLLHSVSHQNQPLSHAIITNAKALVEAQCFLFDTL
jgi:hypothetical protein